MTEITKETQLKQLLKEYPWLMDEAVKIDDRFKVMKTPIGKLFLNKATIGDLSARAGVDANEIIHQLQSWIEQRQ